MPVLPMQSEPQPDQVDAAVDGTSRRRFLGYVVAGSTLVVGGQVGLEALSPAGARATTSVPSNPQSADGFDLSGLIRKSARPTNHLLLLSVERDGTVVFDLPRAEVGQGLTTAFAVVVADAMDIPVEMVCVTLADARPELVFNQITGGSSSLYWLYEPVRALATLARRRLAEVAAREWGVRVSELRLHEGVVFGPGDRFSTYGTLTEGAASDTTQVEQITLLPAQCRFCRPGQIMTAVAQVEAARKAGRAITHADLDGIRNICRCGTYPRIREVISDAAHTMLPPAPMRSPSRAVPSRTCAPDLVAAHREMA